MRTVGRWLAGCLVALVVTTVIYFAPERGEVAVTTVAKPDTAGLAAPEPSRGEDRDALGDVRQEEAEREVALARAQLRTAKAELAEAELALEEQEDMLSQLSATIEPGDPAKTDKIAILEAELQSAEAMVEMQRADVAGYEAELRIAEREAEGDGGGTV